MKIRISLAALLVAVVLVPAQVLGQYHLSEFGAQLGAGLAVPLGAEYAPSADGNATADPGFGQHVGGYFSHWVCGKTYGYQFSLGYRGQSSVSAGSPGGFTNGQSFGTTAYYGFVTAGAYFKWRPKKFHREKEWNLLLGPKLNVLVVDSEDRSSIVFGPLEPDYNRIQPALHGSVWFRFPWSNRRSWFIAPGVDYLPLSIGTTGSGVGFSTVYPHVTFAMTFYNNL